MILCLGASVLGVTHSWICEQDVSKTSQCDVAFYVPILVMLAIASGISGLAVMAVSNVG